MQPDAGTGAVTLRLDDAGRLRVAGRLTYVTVDSALLRRSERLVAANATRVVDLAEVAEGDSAGLALLLEWQCWAHRAGRQLRFENLPGSLRGIAAISEVEALLPPP
jgi:ABC-type transporter Mla MlaB component